MLFTDNTGGYPFAKDPAVVKLNGKYYLYYTSASSEENKKNDKYTIGIACSENMEDWDVIGHLPLSEKYEENGICAPGAIVLNGIVHLFYQNYCFGVQDSICHATSADGINFERDKTNPIYRTGEEWSCGRAIDADVVEFNGKLFLYVATRDKNFEIQMLGFAHSDMGSDFSRDCWREGVGRSILKPELGWEGKCIEAPATICKNGRIYMFYGGAYNCSPQQIGCAVSTDGINFSRMSDEPFLTNGAENEWNCSESGHPYVFEDSDGRIYLFYQGADKDRIWRLSKKEIEIKDNGVKILD